MLKLMSPRSARAVLGLCALSAAATAQTNIPLSPAAQAAGARITSDQGIELVTIGAAGNAPWAGDGTPGDRLYDGTAWNLGGAIGDRLGFPQGGELPSVFFSDFGFRVAAAVPSPSACWAVVGVCWLGTKRRRR